MARIVNSHQPPSALDTPFASPPPPAKRKNCDCSTSASLGTALGATECQGHAIAWTMRP